MKLNISGRASEISIITTRHDMTVGEVKLKLQNLYLLPADDQLLYFSGVLLNNAHLLSSYGIGHNSNLEVVMKDHVSQDTWDQVSRGANEAEEALRTEIRRMHSEIIRSHEQGRIQDGHRSSLPVESPSSAETVTAPEFPTEVDNDQADNADGETSSGEDDSEWSAAEMTPASPETGPSNIPGPQDLANMNLNEQATAPVYSGAPGPMRTFLDSNHDVDFCTQELQKACDAVTQATAAKKELSVQIHALERKLVKAYVTIQEVSQELAEAVDKVAMETQRLRAAVVTYRTAY